MQEATATEAVASGGGEALPSSTPAPEVTTTADVSTAETTVAETPAAPRSMDDTLREVWAKRNQPRDPATQRFVSPNPQPETPETPVVEAPAAETTEAPATETAQPDQALSPIEAPRNFTAEQKAAFSSLTREAQEFVAEAERANEANFTRKAQEFAKFRETAEPFLQAIQPLSQYLNARASHYGVHPAKLVETLVRADYALTTGTPEQKAQYFRQVAADYGVDAQSLFAGQPTNAEGEPVAVDPQINVVKQQLSAATAELNRIKGYLTQQQRAEAERTQKAQDAQLNDTQRLIDDFAKGKSDFSSLETEILGLVQVIKGQEPGLSPTQILEKAYERAVWANPTTRAARIAEQKKAEEQKRKDEAARHAVEAKKAAAANVKSEVGKPSPKSMDDTLRETFRRVSAA
jgi:hypothetical protein